jgi:hypothetical protein
MRPAMVGRAASPSPFRFASWRPPGPHVQRLLAPLVAVEAHARPVIAHPNSLFAWDRLFRTGQFIV